MQHTAGWCTTLGRKSQRLGGLRISARTSQGVGHRRRTHRLLHGEEGQDLQQVVLDDVADDAVLVKVAAPPLGTKVLGEDDLRTWNEGGARGLLEF